MNNFWVILKITFIALREFMLIIVKLKILSIKLNSFFLKYWSGHFFSLSARKVQQTKRKKCLKKSNIFTQIFHTVTRDSKFFVTSQIPFRQNRSIILRHYIV